jgi:hypothetical protein
MRRERALDRNHGGGSDEISSRGQWLSLLSCFEQVFRQYTDIVPAIDHSG